MNELCRMGGGSHSIRPNFRSMTPSGSCDVRAVGNFCPLGRAIDADGRVLSAVGGAVEVFPLGRWVVSGFQAGMDERLTAERVYTQHSGL